MGGAFAQDQASFPGRHHDLGMRSHGCLGSAGEHLEPSLYVGEPLPPGPPATMVPLAQIAESPAPDRERRRRGEMPGETVRVVELPQHFVPSPDRLLGRVGDGAFDEPGFGGKQLP
jgi:hypothetical protein